MNLFEKPLGVQSRWASFENPSAEAGQGGVENVGSKGHAFDSIAAGETRTLLDVQGSGSIRRIWLTVNDRGPEMLRSLRLDMFWDEAKTAAVSVPLGDFFGVSHGLTATFESALLSQPEGRSFNCFIPMPFHSSAKVTITNESGKDLTNLFYDINLLLGERHGAEMLHFHAHWLRKSPNVLGEEFDVLPYVTGGGRFLGCNVGVIANPVYEGSWWGEGEVKFRFGGEEYPTLCGTGAEDYIGTGWGEGAFANRTQGCPIADETAARWSFYRWHLDDPVYFNGGCRASIQTIGGNGKAKVIELLQKGVPLIPVSIDPGTPFGFVQLMERPQPIDLASPDVPAGWCNFWRQDDWCATSYYYLNVPGGCHPPIPPAAERLIQ